jgi:hypothetical protein
MPLTSPTIFMFTFLISLYLFLLSGDDMALILVGHCFLFLIFRVFPSLRNLVYHVDEHLRCTIV